MKQDILKEIAAKKAFDFIDEGITLGIGSGSTVNCFIKLLAQRNLQFKDVVCASQQSTALLTSLDIRVRDLNSCDPVDIYIDSCDEINYDNEMIKGGGAALTREKIIAAASKKFICIADESKRVKTLGNFALPVEVIPMARSYVARQLQQLGGEPRWRRDVVTDNGNWILDVHYLKIKNPLELEQIINNIAGVVSVGIFAKEKAHTLILSCHNGEIAIY